MRDGVKVKSSSGHVQRNKEECRTSASLAIHSVQVQVIQCDVVQV